MKNFLLTFVFSLSLTCVLFAQVITPRTRLESTPKINKGGSVVAPLVDPELFVLEQMIGPCVNVSNVQVTFPGGKRDKLVSPIGMWSDSLNHIGIDEGMIITTGDAALSIDSVGYFASVNLGGLGDANLTSLCGANTFDAVCIEFDFVPLADSIIPFEFVFGSEEFTLYVGAGYNDVFGFYVSGPGYTGAENLALIPGTNTPISIDNVNVGSYSQYYIDNLDSGGTFWAYDGYTTVFSLSVPVVALESYHFKAAIADAGDGIYDSGVVLRLGSFAGNINVPAPSFTYQVEGNSITLTNTTTSGMTYIWDFGDGTFSTEENPVHEYATTGTYILKLTAENYCYTKEFDFEIDLSATSAGIFPQQAIVVQTLYPNPTSDKISINFGEIINSNISVLFTDMLGRKILERTFITNGTSVVTIDLKELSKGVYFIQIDDIDNGISLPIQKIIKN